MIVFFLLRILRIQQTILGSLWFFGRLASKVFPLIRVRVFVDVRILRERILARFRIDSVLFEVVFLIFFFWGVNRGDLIWVKRQRRFTV